jgi:hypothetical protein
MSPLWQLQGILPMMEDGTRLVQQMQTIYGFGYMPNW